MIPRSLSASSLNVAELCLARWEAENFNYSKGMGGFAASLGTSVHGALEGFVNQVRPELGGDPGLYDFKTLEMHFRTSYMVTFATSDPTGEMYDDGLAMLRKWYDRTVWDGVTVISCETKSNFPIKTSAGEIPFNYIWDRHDKLGEGIYKVVDYKSNRWGLRPEDLKKKIQARCYGLAAQIQHPDATEIWVEFDMLRHDPVGIVYTRNENIATWKFIKELAERIIATPAGTGAETLNAECRFCVRKQTCRAIAKNIKTGGVFSITDAREAVDLRANMEYQKAALDAAIAELDVIVLTQAKAEDVLEFESENNRLTVGISTRRSVDPERVEQVIGDDLFRKYGSYGFTMDSLNKLIKGSELDEAKKKALKALVYMKAGEPRVKVVPKNSLEDS